MVDNPKDKKVVKSKWVFRVKTNEKGEVEKYKARVVATAGDQMMMRLPCLCKRDSQLKQGREVNSRGTTTGRIGVCHYFVISRPIWLVQQRRKQSTLHSRFRRPFKVTTRRSGEKQWTARWLACEKMGCTSWWIIQKTKRW